MFTVDQRSAGLSVAPSLPATSQAEMLRAIPFHVARNEIGSPQGQAVTSLGRTCTLGRLPTSFMDHYLYHTVPRAPHAWGAHPPTALIQAYHCNPGQHFQKNQYAFHAGNVNTSQYPRANVYDFPHEPKPTQSYIGLIAIAILSGPDQKLVLSDIYKYIMDHYPYFRSRGHGWRNSIRHNLSLNECFIKSSRSSNGKGHFWAVHPANVEDFQKSDFRRRRAQRKVRKYLSRQKLKSENLSSTDLNGEDEDLDGEVLIDVEIMDDEKLCETATADDSIDVQYLNCDTVQSGEDMLEKDLTDEIGEKNSHKEISVTTKRRGAFDMDTILSSNFPCVRINTHALSVGLPQQEPSPKNQASQNDVHYKRDKM